MRIRNPIPQHHETQRPSLLHQEQRICTGAEKFHGILEELEKQEAQLRTLEVVLSPAEDSHLTGLSVTELTDERLRTYG